jgi:hypothetical protein
VPVVVWVIQLGRPAGAPVTGPGRLTARCFVIDPG